MAYVEYVKYGHAPNVVDALKSLMYKGAFRQIEGNGLAHESVAGHSGA